jgi:integrase
MSVYKRFGGKRVKHGSKDYDKGTWYVSKRIKGRLIHKALPQASSKQMAEKLAERIIARGARDDITFAEFADTTYSRYVHQNNVNTYVKELFIEELKRFFGKFYLTEITAQVCRDYRALRLATPIRGDKKRSNASVNREMSTLSKMFRLACEEGICERSPMEYVTKLKESPPRRRSLTTEQKERLWLELEKDLLLFRLITLAVNLPLRRGQILAIDESAIDLPNALLFARPSKGRPTRIVPLNNSALSTLRAMITDRQLPFPLKDFRKRWHKALIVAGINNEGGSREENFHFHDLRHMFGSELKRRGVDAYDIQQLFGHSDMETSSIYISPEMDNLRRAVETLDVQEMEGIN